MPDGAARRHALVLAACIGIATLACVLLVDNRNDDAYITYRHAANLLAGRGFVFDPAERILTTTAPFHGLLLALLGVVHADLPLVALVVSAIATSVLGYAVFGLLDRLGARAAGLVAAGLVVTMPVVHEVAPLETPLVTALCWGAALWHVRSPRSVGAGVLLGLAIGVRADAAVWAATLFGMHAWRTRRPADLVRPAVPMLLVAGGWTVAAWTLYGDPFPATAAAKTGWAGHTGTFVGALWERGGARLLPGVAPAAAGSALAVWGSAVALRDERFGPIRFVPAWVVAYVLAYTALRIFWPHHWYYVPIVVAAAVLAAVGAVDVGERIAARLPTDARRRLRWPAWSIVLIALVANGVALLDYRQRIASTFFVGGRDVLYRQVADWLRAHTPSDASVAVTEPGTIGYYADRTMVDMMGIVTPAAAVRMKAQEIRAVSPAWTVENFFPDVFVISWPKDRPFPGTLPQAPAYRLAETFATPACDTGVLVYARTGASP